MDLNFESLNQIADLATKAIATTEKGAGLVATVQNLLKKTEAADNSEIKLALAELTAQIADATLANTKLKMELAELKEQALKAQKFQAELDRYSLWQTPRGDFVHRLNEADTGGDPIHYICPNCVENGHKSILQGGEHSNQCPRCEARFRVREINLPEIRSF